MAIETACVPALQSLNAIASSILIAQVQWGSNVGIMKIVFVSGTEVNARAVAWCCVTPTLANVGARSVILKDTSYPRYDFDNY